MGQRGKKGTLSHCSKALGTLLHGHRSLLYPTLFQPDLEQSRARQGHFDMAARFLSLSAAVQEPPSVLGRAKVKLVGLGAKLGKSLHTPGC